MKLVNRSDFIKLPKGTVYQNYISTVELGNLSIKDEMCDNGYDFYFTLLSMEYLKLNCLKPGDNTLQVELNMRYKNAGHESDEFLIYEPIDVTSIINKLQALVVKE